MFSRLPSQKWCGMVWNDRIGVHGTLGAEIVCVGHVEMLHALCCSL